MFHLNNSPLLTLLHLTNASMQCVCTGSRQHWDTGLVPLAVSRTPRGHHGLRDSGCAHPQLLFFTGILEVVLPSAVSGVLTKFQNIVEDVKLSLAPRSAGARGSTGLGA